VLVLVLPHGCAATRPLRSFFSGPRWAHCFHKVESDALLCSMVVPSKDFVVRYPECGLPTGRAKKLLSSIVRMTRIGNVYVITANSWWASQLLKHADKVYVSTTRKMLRRLERVLNEMGVEVAELVDHRRHELLVRVEPKHKVKPAEVLSCAGEDV